MRNLAAGFLFALVSDPLPTDETHFHPASIERIGRVFGKVKRLGDDRHFERKSGISKDLLRNFAFDSGVRAG
ncbi:hypothetical protein CGZ80_18035 [Rhodopirellula sp. MGV]|nr:hypothetical protein CGZ80_18035 [Rhodopirellula sp. MGV]PNY35145.1 hypothetical protein C2E31_19780 [Rhodopirellula baltica]